MTHDRGPQLSPSLTPIRRDFPLADRDTTAQNSSDSTAGAVMWCARTLHQRRNLLASWQALVSLSNLRFYFFALDDYGMVFLAHFGDKDEKREARRGWG